MANLFIRKSYVNETEGYRCGDSDVYETAYDNPSDLYRGLRESFGRCQSIMYRDAENGKSQKIGWVFIKRVKYDDCKKTYLQSVWVSVYSAPPTKTVEYHYAQL